MIEVRNLSKSFNGNFILKGISVEIQKGERIAVIGSSGAGKSLFLRCLSMLEKPDSGSIKVNNVEINSVSVNINKIREKMGMVYQGFHLFSHLNSLSNITLAPVKIKKKSRVEAEKKAMELLSLVGLTEKAYSYPNELSGGQQQRIAIARCLAMEPEIIFFDEPTSALDPVMSREVFSIIQKLSEMNITMILVTHEMKFAEKFARRVFYLDDQCIYEEGPPNCIFYSPKKEKTKKFIKQLRIFHYLISSRFFDIIEMNAKIDIFCGRYQIKEKTSYHIQLLLEELIMIIIKYCYHDTLPDMDISIEYSEENHDVFIFIKYKSLFFYPLNDEIDQDEQIGILLVKKIAKSISHEYENGENNLTLKI